MKRMHRVLALSSTLVAAHTAVASPPVDHPAAIRPAQRVVAAPPDYFNGLRRSQAHVHDARRAIRLARPHTPLQPPTARGREPAIGSAQHDALTSLDQASRHLAQRGSLGTPNAEADLQIARIVAERAPDEDRAALMRPIDTAMVRTMLTAVRAAEMRTRFGAGTVRVAEAAAQMSDAASSAAKSLRSLGHPALAAATLEWAAERSLAVEGVSNVAVSARLYRQSAEFQEQHAGAKTVRSLQTRERAARVSTKAVAHLVTEPRYSTDTYFNDAVRLATTQWLEVADTASGLPGHAMEQAHALYRAADVLNQATRHLGGNPVWPYPDTLTAGGGIAVTYEQTLIVATRALQVLEHAGLTHAHFAPALHRILGDTLTARAVRSDYVPGHAPEASGSAAADFKSAAHAYRASGDELKARLADQLHDASQTLQHLRAR